MNKNNFKINYSKKYKGEYNKKYSHKIPSNS